MSEQKYGYLEYHGKCIFNAVYDGDQAEEENQIQEFNKELLQIFQTETISAIRNNTEMLDIPNLHTKIQAAIFQGILTEALHLSKNQKQMLKSSHGDFPIRNAVNSSRNKVNDILQSFRDFGPGAATAYIKRLLEESRSETSMFKTQAREALQKFSESEEARKKTSLRLAEATQKFLENRRMLLAQQGVLEEEKSLLIWERDNFARDAERATVELTRLDAKNTQLEETVMKQTAKLNFANDQLKEKEAQLKENKKAHANLIAIGQAIKAVAKSGHTWPEQLLSILNELAELRKQQEKFKTQEAGYSGIVQKYENSKAMIEALVIKIDDQDRLLQEARNESTEDINTNSPERVLGTYILALKEYFELLICEFPKNPKNLSRLNSANKQLKTAIYSMNSKELNYLKIGEAELIKLANLQDKWWDLTKNSLPLRIINGTHKAVTCFLENPLLLESEIYNIIRRFAGSPKSTDSMIHTYVKMGAMWDIVDMPYQEVTRA